MRKVRLAIGSLDRRVNFFNLAQVDFDFSDGRRVSLFSQTLSHLFRRLVGVGANFGRLYFLFRE